MSDGQRNLRDVPAGAVVRIVLIASAALLIPAAVLLAVMRARNILVLAVVALFFTIGLDPLVRRLGRRRVPRPAAVAAVFVGALLIIGGFLASISPPLVRQTQHLAEEIPDFAERLSASSGRFADLNERYDLSERLRGFIEDLPQVAARSAGNVIGVLRSVGTAFFNIFTVVVLTIYLLLDFPRIEEGFLRLVALSRRERVRRITDVVFARISGYLLGQIAVSVIAGLAAMIALAAIRIPYWLPLALWVGLSAVIPMIGASIGAIPAVIVAFFASPVKGIITLAYFLAYQQAENTLIHPRVMRQAVDISPPAVILSALIGATLFGFAGALLAIPLAASVKALVQELWMPRQETA